MNWKLVLQLSLIGLAMALAGVFFIPANLEPVFWLAIYIFWAHAIASRCRFLRFFNGLALGLANSVWVTLADVVFLDRYLARHPRARDMIEMLHVAHVYGSQRQILWIAGLVTGVAIGCVVGVFTVIAGLMIKPKRAELAADPQP